MPKMRVYLLLWWVIWLLCCSSVVCGCKSSEERARGGGKSPQADGKVVCSNMELHQVLPVDSFPNRTVTL